MSTWAAKKYYIIFSFQLASANQIAAFTVQYKAVLYREKLYCTVVPRPATRSRLSTLRSKSL